VSFPYIINRIQRTDFSSNGVLPAGFIVTGPNISSQGLLFDQLSERLRNQAKGPTVLLRSGDASNLKNALKQVIRDTTNQRDVVEDEGVNVQDEYVSLLSIGIDKSNS